MNCLTWVICLLAMKPTEQAGKLKATFELHGEDKREHFFKDIFLISEGEHTNVYQATLTNDAGEAICNVILKTATSRKGNELQRNENTVISDLKELGYSQLPNILYFGMDAENFFEMGEFKLIIIMDQLVGDFLKFLKTLRIKHNVSTEQLDISKLVPVAKLQKDGIIVARGIPYPVLLPFIVQLLELLDGLQPHEIVHRDIKSENLLLTEKNKLMAADWAFASYASSTVYRTGVRGTFINMRMAIIEKIISINARSIDGNPLSPEEVEFVAVVEDDAVGAAWCIADWLLGVPFFDRAEGERRPTFVEILNWQREYIAALGTLAERYHETSLGDVAKILFDFFTRAQTKDWNVPSKFNFPYEAIKVQFQQVLDRF